jgi:hypothetical protein
MMAMADDDHPQPWPVLAERLPGLVHGQFAAYRRLAALETGEDDGPREVTAWENARKAALAHLQALIRIHDLVQAHLAAGEGAGSAELERMLASVRLDLANGDDAGGEGEA